ncbi:hypothetical protein J1614_000271 [Plenodomus biglobosus]|nr:hypothetical protein J1614_000271 [Plenodomus biglobosus]
MAAKEYYFGTQGVHELPGQHHPSSYPHKQLSQPQYQQPPAQSHLPRPQYNASSYSSPPPSYSAYPDKPPQQSYPQQYAPQQYPEKRPQQYSPPQQYPGGKQPRTAAPYPTTPPVTYPAQQQPHPGYLGAPLHPFRSHSQPAAPRVHFADQDSDRSTELGETDDSSDSSTSSRTHRRHARIQHNYTRDSDSSATDRKHRHHKHHRPRSRETKSHDKEHKNLDTFLGAGAGTIIGDALFPGLGTAAGLLLGGYGGRKYAERSCSEDGEGRERRRKGSYEEYRGRKRR